MNSGGILISMVTFALESKLLTILMGLWSTAAFLRKVPSRYSAVKPVVFGSSMYSLMMDTPVLLRGIGEIADRYDLFLFDQFGVLHNGVQPVPGAVSMMEELKKLKKTSIIVSNTSNLSKIALKKLIELGFPSSAFEGGVVTSGESAHRWIDSLCLAEGRRKCCFITWREGRAYSSHGEHSFLASLNVEISSAEEADFIFFHGTQSIASSDVSILGTPITLYEDGNVLQEVLQHSLQQAASRGIPAVCANLDMIAMVPSGAAHMPGALKKSYEEMGGTCVGFGKPNKEYFALAMEMASRVHRETYGISSNVLLKAIHIGDSVHHDIAGNTSIEISFALYCSILFLICTFLYSQSQFHHSLHSTPSFITGAAAARIDSILITGDGVHRDELENTRVVQELTNYSNDIRYASSVSTTVNSAGVSVPQIVQKSLISKVCDLCDREKTARPTFILEHCKY